MTEHPNLAAALVAALADLTVVEAAKSAKIEMKGGGSYSYKYADIGDVVKLTRPALAAHGIVALTPVHDHGDGLGCTVTFLHTSGERLDLGPFPFPHGRDAQSTGSMVTYHRRYALVAALGIAAGDDDDGASAAPRERTEVPASVRPSSSNEKRELVQRLSELNQPTNGSLEELRERLAKIEGGAPDREAGEPVGSRDATPADADANPPSSDPTRPFEMTEGQAAAERIRAKAAEKAPVDRKAVSAQ